MLALPPVLDSLAEGSSLKRIFDREGLVYKAQVRCGCWFAFLQPLQRKHGAALLGYSSLPYFRAALSPLLSKVGWRMNLGEVT